MQGQADVATPEEYLASLEEPRRTEVARIDTLIRETAPELDPHIGAGMLAYGSYHYRYPTGREGDWFVLGLASNKRAISLYVSAGDGEHYLVERYADRLGRVDLGRSCIRFRKADDLDEAVVVELIREAIRMLPTMPGITMTDPSDSGKRE